MKVASQAIAVLVLAGLAVFGYPQSSGSAGTIEVVVEDPQGGVIKGAKVTLANRITGYRREVESDSDGRARFRNVPPNQYHLEAGASGFTSFTRDVAVRSTVPLTVRAQLALQGIQQSVEVEASGADLIEGVTHAHVDVGGDTLSKLPVGSPGSQLSDAITLTAPGVTADSNGFFHPLGDHAQVTFSIDGQPISDQQSKAFSTQIPLNAIQSMELITGSQPAEFGDKTSLVVSATTKSGLGQKPHGSFNTQYGSFGTVAEESSLGGGTAKFGAFGVFNVLRSGRFLDTPEFRPIHAVGNNGSAFVRLDYNAGPKDALHLNMFSARNWFQVPNTFDQKFNGQDQRQKALTYSFAPGWQHTFSANLLLTVNPFVRRDAINYYPSRDDTQDTPVSVAQHRTLNNWGVRADLAWVKGRHNAKFGTQLMQTRLDEQFTLRVTDPDFDFSEAPGLSDKPFAFAAKHNINQQALFVQDTYTLGNWNFSGGLRYDEYRGLITRRALQPRAGVSYTIRPSSTVFRAAYARTFETPYNENLLLSSSTGAGGLATNVFGGFGAAPIEPGRRNQFNVGMQQAISKWFMVDADYFWKFTDNAFDFGTLLNSPITFPISWQKSKIDGLAVRVSTPVIHGFQWHTTLGHSRARFFGPANGGLLFNSPLETAVFRIDHDQALQATTNIRYQWKKYGPWAAFTWRYDSGMVAGAVASLDDALALTAAEQSAIGFSCNGVPATISSRIEACDGGNFSASRLRIPSGEENPDHNPPRIAPRHILSLGLGTENLFHKERFRTTLRFGISNLTNQVALYNFQSTFSGTHFVNPRAYQAEVGFVF
jgi:outer membrane cobalamin receptor